MIASKRLMKELEKINAEDNIGITILSPKNSSDNIFIWNVVIDGPKDTPYEDGKFELLFKFDTDYPLRPPSVRFITPIIHINVYFDGKICIDILQDQWAPSLSVRTILYSLMSLLNEPNPNSPANRKLTDLYEKNITEYTKTIKAHVKENLGKKIKH